MSRGTARPAAVSSQERAARAASSSPHPTDPAFVWIGAYAARRGQHAPPHRYDVWKLTYYRAGRIDAFIDTTRYAVTPGTVLAVPPRADHSEVAHRDYANYYLLVNAPPDWPWPPVMTDDGSFGTAFTHLLHEISATDEHSPAMLTALVRQIDITLRRDAVRRRTDSARATVAAAERLLEERHPDPLRIAEVAQAVGVSGSTLRAWFAATIGMSPKARLLEIRLRHAVVLLQTSDLTLSVIARRCGYHSASHLSRHLKTVMGCAPGTLRRP